MFHLSKTMHSFKTKALRQTLLLSELFKRQRETQQLSLELCAKKLSIQKKYLCALEETHGNLPGQVYARTWIRRYADFLGLTADDCWRQYQREQGLIQTITPKVTSQSKALKFWTVITQARIMRNGAVAIAGLAVICYISWSIYQTFEPPTIAFDKPFEDSKTTESAINVSGSSTPGAQLWFNDKLVIVDEAGHFKQEILLASGLNIVTIRAKTKHSRSYERTVQIVKTDAVGIANTGDETAVTN